MNVRKIHIDLTNSANSRYLPTIYGWKIELES
jgi:hypothetical protein